MEETIENKRLSLILEQINQNVSQYYCQSEFMCEKLPFEQLSSQFQVIFIKDANTLSGLLNFIMKHFVTRNVCDIESL